MSQERSGPWNFLRDTLWFEAPCIVCVLRPGGILNAPRLKFNLYATLEDHGTSKCPVCATDNQQSFEGDAKADAALLAQLDNAWQRISDLIDRGGANLIPPPDR